jgi:NodT family efflux transporter outer membrane factor (OMF) lipoprotein
MQKRDPMRRRFSARPTLPALVPALAAVFLGACMVGPNYKRPTAPAPPAFKEQPPPDYKEAGGWKPAQPSDDLLKGKWWEIYNDPALNALEEQVSLSNQNLAQAEAVYREARAAVLISRAALSPTVSAEPAVTESRAGGNSGPTSTSGLRSTFAFPLDAAWAPDLWGNIRRGVTAAAANAQASAANLENARLLYQSELAQDYFQLHGLDGEADLLQRTLQSYDEYLTLTKNRKAGGIASDLDVAQAEAQLYATRASLQDLGIQRAQLEHAIAVLIGKPPAELSIAGMTLKNPPPPVPVAVPSVLLERRPDIAAGERQMAAANEQIGIAQAAYYPTLSLSAALGLENTRITTWISWPARFFSVGATMAETVFDAGRRRAAVAQSQAAFDATIAAYRQTVLGAFQQVEDNLAALRVLAEESVTADQSVASAERALTVSTAQYKAGTTSYLTVIEAQATALAAERTAVDLLTRRFTASVLLVQALGGGWDTSQLPTPKDVAAKGN